MTAATLNITIEAGATWRFGAPLVVPWSLTGVSAVLSVAETYKSSILPAIEALPTAEQNAAQTASAILPAIEALPTAEQNAAQAAEAVWTATSRTVTGGGGGGGGAQGTNIVLEPITPILSIAATPAPQIALQVLEPAVVVATTEVSLAVSETVVVVQV